MDNASDYGSEDSRFDSWLARSCKSACCSFLETFLTSPTGNLPSFFSTLCTGKNFTPNLLQDTPSFTTSAKAAPPLFSRCACLLCPHFSYLPYFHIISFKGKYHSRRTWPAQHCVLSFQPHCFFAHLAMETHTHTLAAQPRRATSTHLFIPLHRAIFPSSCPHLFLVSPCTTGQLPILSYHSMSMTSKSTEALHQTTFLLCVPHYYRHSKENAPP